MRWEDGMPGIGQGRITRVLAVAVFRSILSLAGCPSSAAELIPFKVGEASPANTFLAIWMAQAAGFYEREGLKVEVVHMSGGRESGPELKSGRVNLIHVGMSSVIRANLAGGTLRNIGSRPPHVRATRFAAQQK